MIPSLGQNYSCFPEVTCYLKSVSTCNYRVSGYQVLKYPRSLILYCLDFWFPSGLIRLNGVNKLNVEIIYEMDQR